MSWTLKKVLNKAVLQPANLSKAVKRRRGRKINEQTQRRGNEGKMERWQTRRSARTGLEEKMEGEEGRNVKMNERKSDKNSSF